MEGYDVPRQNITVYCNDENANKLVKTMLLSIIDLAVVLGNSLVIAAVFTTRKLRTVTNIYIVSLACADLLLGFAVLPFSISVEVDVWLWGQVWCSMWLAIDVWLCTASIFSLCAISFDRFIAVTHPIRYPTIMSPSRGRWLVASVWVLSFVVCLPPLLGWTDSALNSPSSSLLNELNMTCELTTTTGYRIYAALCSFFIPMLVMVFFYVRIYLTAVRTAASIRKGVLKTKISNDISQPNGYGEDEIHLRVHRGGSTSSRKSAKHCDLRASLIQLFNDQVCLHTTRRWNDHDSNPASLCFYDHISNLATKRSNNNVSHHTTQRFNNHDSIPAT
ncbi:octopamine receptor Oamb-like [Mya arenaria]|uniref:octopamine receptor Oamb-like n=1 Tax=Mya arenaria TaxID=6604 RepID=UPI0022E1230A|nr:octopamine receptor Oamb-like [Mya arenaria]